MAKNRKVSIGKGSSSKKGSRGRRYNKIHDSSELPPTDSNHPSTASQKKKGKKKQKFTSKSYNDDDSLRQMIEGKFSSINK